MKFNQLQRFGLAVMLVAGFILMNDVAVTAGVPLHDGLIGYWALNEGSGDTATDTAPGGAVADNGALRNAPSWISGMFGAGLQFNGTDQDVLLLNSTDMDINSNAVTLSAWVKLDQLPTEIGGSFAGVLDSAPDNYVMYLDKSNNELRFKVTDANGTSTSPSTAHPGIPAAMLNTTDWLHVMGVYDGAAGAVKIYLNGSLADIGSISTTVGTVRAGQVASIGAQPTAEDPYTPSNFFAGGIADVALWNRPLGAAEASYLYNSGTGNAVGSANPSIDPIVLVPTQPTASPVIYYAFNGNLSNSGTGGAALDAVLHDEAGRNDTLFTPTTWGTGLDLRENPPSTNSTADNGDYLSVDYELPEQGTIALQFMADKMYNYQTLWSNSVHGNAWESWIYGDSRVSARANEGTSAAALDFLLNLVGATDTTHHIAFTWERDGDKMTSQLYVDGVLREVTKETWRDPGTTFFIAGGLGIAGGANHLGSGIYDDFRIYDVALSDSEILYLARIPEPSSILLAGFVAALISCIGYRRRCL